MGVTTNQLDDRLRTIENELAEKRGSSRTWNIIFSSASGLLLTFCGILYHRLDQLNTQVIAINTLLTKELPKIALNNIPVDSKEAASHYETTAKILEHSALVKAKVDKSVFNDLSRTLASQEPTHGDLPQYWQLASLLINARSINPDLMAQPNCLNTPFPKGFTEKGPDGQLKQYYSIEEERRDGHSAQDQQSLTLEMHDCELKLDDPDFPSTQIARKAEELKTKFNGGSIILILQRARITYNGGTVIPINQFVFNRCSFEYKPTGVPSSPAKSVGTQLLTAAIDQKFELLIG